MTKARLLIAFGTVICALAAMTTPAFALFLVLLAEGTKELSTKITSETKGVEEKFEALGGTFKCEGPPENVFYGTEELKGHETNLITVLPWYHGEKSGCHVEGAFKTTTGEVHHNGCTYIFRQVAKGEKPEKEPYAGDVNVACPEGREIEFITNILGCIIFVPKTGNGSIPGVEFLNLPEKTPLDIHITVNATGISSHSNSNCVGLEKEKNAGLYKATTPILVTAHNSSGTTLAIHVDPFTAE